MIVDGITVVRELEEEKQDRVLNFVSIEYGRNCHAITIFFMIRPNSSTDMTNED